MKRKFFMLIVFAVLIAVTIAGCRANNNSVTPSTSPTRIPSATSVAPSVSASPNTTGGLGTTEPMMSGTPGISADPGAMTTENMNDTTAAAAITEQLDKLSEVKASQAVVVGDTVLVSVEFDNQYQGGMTDRVRQMVEEKVKAAHQNATNIYITDDETHRTKIGELVTRTGEDIKNDVMDLVDDIKATL